MSAETTEWKSAFWYDNNHSAHNDALPSHFPFQYKVAAVIDGTFYDISSNYEPTVSDDCIVFQSNYYTSVYNETNGYWEPSWYHDSVLHQSVLLSDIRAQNLDIDVRNYYSTDQFNSGNIPVPMGTYFDSIYTTDALEGVLAVLPVVLAVLIGFLAVRKGISFFRSCLNRG